MFKGFSKLTANRPPKIDPEPGPLAEAFNNRSSNFHLKQPEIISREEGRKLAENSQRQDTSAAAATVAGSPNNNNNKDHNGNNTSPPLSVPSNTTTRCDGAVSDPIGSQFDSNPPSVNDVVFKSTAAAQGFGSFGATAIKPAENKPSTGSGTVTAPFSSVPLASGAATGIKFGTGTGPKNGTGFGTRSGPGTVAKTGSGNGFTGFGGKSAPEPEFSSTTATPVEPRPAPVSWSEVPAKALPAEEEKEKAGEKKAPIFAPRPYVPEEEEEEEGKKKKPAAGIFAPRPYYSTDEDEQMKPDLNGFRGKCAQPTEFSSTTAPSYTHPHPLQSRDRRDSSAASSVVSFGASRASVDAAAAGAARLFRNAMAESVRTTSPKCSPNTSPSSSSQQQQQPRQSMRSAAAAAAAGTGAVKKDHLESGGFASFGTTRSTAVPPQYPPVTPKTALALAPALVEPPMKDTDADRASFGCFVPLGAMKSAVAPAPAPVPVPAPTPSAALKPLGSTAASGFASFGTASKPVFSTKVEEETVAAKEDTVPVQASRGGGGGFGFTSFGSALNGRVSVLEGTPEARAAAAAAALAALPKTRPECSSSSSSRAEYGGFAYGKSLLAADDQQEQKKTAESVDKVRMDFGTLHVSGPPQTMKVLAERAQSEAQENDFAGFGVFKEIPPPSQQSVDKVRMDFGTLHVSGPPQTMKVLAERAQSEAAEMEAKKRAGGGGTAKRRVHFEEEEQAVDRREERAAAAAAAAAVVNDVPQPREEQEEEEEAAAESVHDNHDTDTDDDGEQPPRLYPWGARISLRERLDEGRKKLKLVPAPLPISNYFYEQVYKSYGCTYDNVTNTFYATSPGAKGTRTGKVVALDGSTKKEPVVVASNLAEPAAIAVYEPGLSVCTVTNRGIFVLTKSTKEQGDVYLSRQISNKPFHRGIATTARGGIVSFSNGRIRMFDGNVDNGQERVLTETNYDDIINSALFSELPNRRNEKSNCCFLDVVHNRLVMSDLQKHVISLWDIEETDKGCAIHFLRAIDVAICENPGRGRPGVVGAKIPPGKCAYASGIRLDCEGWVLCADADGRTIQIFDDQLKFMTRLESAEQLPYISGLYLEAKGHLMVCDRKSEMGSLLVYLLETEEAAPKKKPLGFAAASAASRAQQEQQDGSRC